MGIKTQTAIMFLVVNATFNFVFTNTEHDWKILVYQMIAIICYGFTLHMIENTTE